MQRWFCGLYTDDTQVTWFTDISVDIKPTSSSKWSLNQPFWLQWAQNGPLGGLMLGKTQNLWSKHTHQLMHDCFGPHLDALVGRRRLLCLHCLMVQTNLCDFLNDRLSQHVGWDGEPPALSHLLMQMFTTHYALFSAWLTERNNPECEQLINKYFLRYTKSHPSGLKKTHTPAFSNAQWSCIWKMLRHLPQAPYKVYQSILTSSLC